MTATVEESTQNKAGGTGRIARVILWSTAVAFFSFSAVVALLR